jgi:hypothetical protein
MSEQQPTYFQPPGTPSAATLLRYGEPDYQAPTWQDVRNLVKSSGMTGEQIAQLVGVAGRTVRKWQSPPDTSNHAPIPYSAWRLLLLETNIVKLQGV